MQNPITTSASPATTDPAVLPDRPTAVSPIVRLQTEAANLRRRGWPSDTALTSIVHLSERFPPAPSPEALRQIVAGVYGEWELEREPAPEPEPEPAPDVGDWRLSVETAAARGHLKLSAVVLHLVETGTAAGLPRSEIDAVLAPFLDASEEPAPVAVPEVPVTPEGFARVLKAAGWRLAWDERTRCAVARRDGETEWTECAGLTRHLMFEDCAAAAILPRRSVLQDEPWRIRSVRLEDRLLACVAAENRVEGEGSAVYEAVRDWARLRRNDQITLSRALTGARVLQKYESASRAPKSVFADARQALIDLGWKRRGVQVNGEPRYRWCAPPGPAAAQVALRVVGD